MTIREGNVNALIKVAGADVEPFWFGLFAKALANVDVGSLLCNVEAGGPVPVAAVPQQEVPPLHCCSS